ncbi:MAG: ribosomal L28e protein family-domain-containing protein [Olpidium bornovanus]|uniref:Ribosomal L28e protein family-domain-containing protein n=1 Tax=Olpidium bornovanus TaxID=278681 RepID=A0A8H7ZX77_9FUNG|nr:MAG: ribosomal L28e protein family-domain-containing protein [Olpidium bornovanus]
MPDNSALVWLLTKNNSSFLVKRSGEQFSSEKGNLLNKNSWKYSGLANKKVVDVPLGKNNKPYLRTGKKSVRLNKGARNNAVRITKELVLGGYRADLHRAALAKMTALTRPPSKACTVKTKGRRAERAAARSATATSARK